MAQEPTMLRVGIPPAMLGQEGDTPIVVEIPRHTPPDQVRDVALAQARATQPATKRLGLSGGPGQFAGLDLPAEGVDETHASILKAIPQIAGLIAQFTPVGRTGMKGAAAVPSIVELARQLFAGEEMDVSQAATQGAGGMLAHGAGKAIAGVGNAGTDTVKRALNIRGEYANRTGEAFLPKTAVSEKATMTVPGVDKVRQKAAATGLGGLDDLANVLEQARLDASLGPNIPGGATSSILHRALSPPRQMAIGSAMAAPFGVDTAKTLAPGGEAGVRALLAWLSAQLGSSEQAPDTGGPQRKPLR